MTKKHQRAAIKTLRNRHQRMNWKKPPTALPCLPVVRNRELSFFFKKKNKNEKSKFMMVTHTFKSLDVALPQADTLPKLLKGRHVRVEALRALCHCCLPIAELRLGLGQLLHFLSVCEREREREREKIKIGVWDACNGS